MPPKCKKFKKALENNCIDLNFDGTYDIEGTKNNNLYRKYNNTEYMIITYCPFCGEKL